MKKILLVLAAFAALSAGLGAQDINTDMNQIQLTKEGSRIETDLHYGFPMYFGWSSLTDVNYKGAWQLPDWDVVSGSDARHFLATKTGKNFVYGLEMVSLHFSKPDGLLDVSLGLRWTFMDFTLSNSALTFRKGSSDVYIPYPIELEASGYDGRKSKIHANYLGVPLRLTLDCGKVKPFLGVSAEYLVSGYTKYKFPKHHQDAAPVFNRFRATVEGGIYYGVLGFFVNYGLTPLFPESLSDARTFTFGIIFGR